MSPPTSSSPSNSINENPTSSSPKLSARGTANHAPHHSLSGISAAKAALSRSNTHSKPRRPTLISSSSNAQSKGDSNQEEILEIERNKIQKLKTDYDLLLLEAEEREQESIKECQIWKSRTDELSEQIIRFESDLVKFNEIEEKSIRLEKELERSKYLVKDFEHRLELQNDEYDLARSQWAETENELKSRLSHLTNELTNIQKEEDQKPNKSPSLNEGESGEIEFNRSPTFRSPTLNPASASTGPPSLSNLQLEAALSETKKEVTKAVSEAEGLRRALAVLREQLSDAERVNEQLMDDNESYQFLVGEKTLMGGFDLKQLLSIDHLENEEESEDKNEKLTSGSELASVAEETEEENDDSIDDIEKAVLEAQGNGSRTTGAVEAEVINPRSTRRPLKKALDNSGSTGGGGLDLAAELAQAEQSEEIEMKRKETEERRKKKGSNGRPGAKDKDAEIKFLTDANKALVLYISKILDRIQAHEGFERVLAHDYKKEGGGPNSPSRKLPAPAQTTATTPSPGGLNSFFNVLTKSSTVPDRKTLNLASAATTTTASSNPSRASWLQFFTASKSPPAAPTTSTAGIKPLKLGTGNAALSSGWQGLEEDEEDVKERERLRAELKLHGIDKTGSGSRVEAARSNTLDNTVKANRRNSNLYDKRMSADQLNPTNLGLTSPPIISPAGVMKRSEEREKESKVNLEKGIASGFTEIEIRGSRLRPSASTRVSGTISPTSPSFNQKILGNELVGSPTLGATGSTGNGGNASGSEDGILAKAAKRITLMRS